MTSQNTRAYLTLTFPSHVSVLDPDDNTILATYSLDGATDEVVLRANGWRSTPAPDRARDGDQYVRAHHWPTIVEQATEARRVADEQFKAADRTWRTLVRDGMSDPGAPKGELARAAGISPARANQIKHGTRYGTGHAKSPR